MDDLDHPLKILLKDFVRLCPEDAPLEQDDWAGLYEICLFVHEQKITCPASTIRTYLVEQGCSERKAIFLSRQYGHFLQLLTLRDQRTSSPTQPLGTGGDGAREAGL